MQTTFTRHDVQKKIIDMMGSIWTDEIDTEIKDSW